MIGRAAAETAQQVSDVRLASLVPRQLDRALEALCFQELVDLRHGEGGVGAEVATELPISIPGDEPFQHLAPAIGRAHTAGTQGAAL